MVDASVALAWTLPDKATESAVTFLEHIATTGAIAPAIWHWEVQNALRTALRRRRIDDAQCAEAITNLRSLGVILQATAPLGRDLALAQEHDISVYDAAYLELALRTGSKLATADVQLAAVAERNGILLA